MRFSSTLITAAIAILPVFGAPLAPKSLAPVCTNPTIRRSWTTLNKREKQAYFDAELCLLKAPAKTSNAGVMTRYDDLVVAHQLNSNLFTGTDTWHLTGQFLHMHRYYAHAHETLLRNECKYTGPMVYWNEVVDAGAFGTSPVLADFGGPGNDAGAVVTGPFANLTLNIGPGAPDKNTKHLLNRAISETSSIRTGQTYVDQIMANTTFASFKSNMFGGIHVSGHAAVGGDMRDVQSSPNDPLFFLHHNYIDSVWARWQKANASRVNEIAGAGYETQAEPATGYVATSASTVLSLYDIIPNATVADVASTRGGYLCYVYDV